MNDFWNELFAPCYCVPVRAAAAQLQQEADSKLTSYLYLDGKPVVAGDVEVKCPHCNDTKVIPTTKGRECLGVLLVHLKKLQQKPQIPF